MRDVNLPPCEVICCWFEACFCLAQERSGGDSIRKWVLLQGVMETFSLSSRPLMTPLPLLGRMPEALDAQDQSRDRCVG